MILLIAELWGQFSSNPLLTFFCCLLFSEGFAGFPFNRIEVFACVRCPDTPEVILGQLTEFVAVEGADVLSFGHTEDDFVSTPAAAIVRVTDGAVVLSSEGGQLRRASG